AAYQEAGYVAVVYDTRGRGKSEGVFQPDSPYDGTDGHDAVEWAAAQEWCDGNVGVTGISYMGWVVIATMANRPPHLKAAIPISAAGRFQQELPYTYGCFWLYNAFWFAFVRRRINDRSRKVSELVPILPVEAIGEAIDPAGPGWQEFLEHETLDELWRSRRWDGEYEFDVPCLHVTGWHDREDIWGTFHHYEEMLAASPARERQWLLVGPWSHTSCRHPTDVYDGIEYPGAGLDMNAIHLRFFDRFLKGEDNGVDAEPKVRMYDPGAKRWEVRESWTEGTREHELFLADGSALAAAPGAAGETTYRYDPLRPNGNPFDPDSFPWEPPIHLAGLEAQEGVVTWTSEPLEERLTVRGWGETVLWAATDGEDTDWHLKLADVDADGTSLFVSWGCLRASYGEDEASLRAVPPGEVREYAIELTPIFHSFEPGHRLRLVLASSEYPWFARNLNRFEPIGKQSDPRVATNSVFHGTARPSRLRLRVEQ
ncbi:MAG TPA: CocE/NonD family hydrolase, partial [Solirubrobacterales bacterium]|nr:CocE/NonD family hydrolase [Solirubrobacterales bacterium]